MKKKIQCHVSILNIIKNNANYKFTSSQFIKKSTKFLQTIENFTKISLKFILLKVNSESEYKSRNKQNIYK